VNELTDVVRRYAEAVADPAAVGPDPHEDEGVRGGPSHGGRHRVLLVACLALLVAGVAGVILAQDRGGSTTTPATPVDPPTMTVTGGDDRLSVAVAVTGPEVPFGATITARTRVTNESDEPQAVLSDAGWSTQLVWDAPPARNPAAQESLDAAFAIYTTASFAGAAREGSVATDDPGPPLLTLQPGETIEIEATLVVDEDVRTGEVRLVVAVQEQGLRSSGPTGKIVPVDPAAVVVPITIGAPPEPATTRPDAVVLAFTAPELQDWFDAAATYGMAGVAQAGTRETEVGWRVRFGPGTDVTGTDVGADEAMRNASGPGFLVDVATDGTVAVDWIRPPGPSGTGG
jgi:hypothetical protein